MRKKFLCVIPARGRSKRLRNKNRRLLAGKPMLAYVIRAAIQSGLFEEVYVSTEDVRIASIARRFGATVPFLRPMKLSADDVTMPEVCAYMIQALERFGNSYRNLFMLSPTSPLLSATDLRKASSLFEEKKATSLVSIAPFGHVPFWGLRMNRGRIQPWFKNRINSRRQTLPVIYRANGAISIAEMARFKKYKTFYLSRTVGYLMPKERSVDVDELIDFEFAEFLLRKKRK